MMMMTMMDAAVVAVAAAADDDADADVMMMMMMMMMTMRVFLPTMLIIIWIMNIDNVLLVIMAVIILNRGYVWTVN